LSEMFWIPRPLLNGALRAGPADFVGPYGIEHGQDGTETSREAHFVECAGIDQAQHYVTEWTDLAARSLEANVFLDPSFALAAARHISSAAQPEFLLVWESGAVEARGRLVGLWPLVFPRTVFGGAAKIWVHEFSCCGSPLLDGSQALEVIDLMFRWLQHRHPHVHVISASQLPKAGPACGLLHDHVEAEGLNFRLLRQFDRAALNARIVGIGARDFVAPKKKKELQRQFRRLRELGSVTFGVARDGAALRDQVEAFMALEASGWKGRQGDAFLNDPALATFLRAMTRMMGLEGKCRIYWMALDGRMIAGNIVLIARDRAYFWKTTYDEDYGFASPGVLLTMDMTDRLLQETKIAMADSCAIPDHPMIDHLWRGRMRIADIMMSLHQERAKAFNGAVQREKFRRGLRERAKSALAHFRSG
jgi:CelD/BcsL family acetyltransferase involved in cellulose biosynthesis